MSREEDVLVVGAGVVGLCVAWRCATRGMSVHLVDRGAPGGGATQASAGVLTPTEPFEWEGPLGAFNREAIGFWPGFAAELEETTGHRSGFEQRGELRLLRSDADTTYVEAAEAGAKAFGLTTERLQDERLDALEPGLAPGLEALHLPDAAAVNVDELVPALEAACAATGVRRATEELTDVSGDAGQTVLCTGAWARGVIPLLGESVLLSGTPCRQTLRSADGGVVPRSDGTLWLGATVEERGFAVTTPRAGAVRDIIANAAAFLPAVAELPFLGARVGLRPKSPDGLPLVGPSDRPNVSLATGHGREGLIHAPLTGELVSRALADGPWPAELGAFAPERLQ